MMETVGRIYIAGKLFDPFNPPPPENDDCISLLKRIQVCRELGLACEPPPPVEPEFRRRGGTPKGFCRPTVWGWETFKVGEVRTYQRAGLTMEQLSSRLCAQARRYGMRHQMVFVSKRTPAGLTIKRVE